MIYLLTALALSSARLSAEASTSASFLNLEAGAQAAALGGAVASRPSVGSLFYNPGALGWIEGAELTASHSELGYSGRAEHLAAAYGLKNLSLGISLQALTITGMEERILPSAVPLSTFGATALATAATFSRRLGSRLSAGTSLKLIYQKIGADQAYTVANDLGLSFSRLAYGLQAGASLTNWGGGVKFANQSYPLPTRARLGLGYGVLRDALSLYSDLVIPRGRPLFICLGSEWKIKDRLDIRAGYRGGMSDAGSAAGLSGGLGVRLSGYRVDYAALSRGALGLVHQFSISYRPGAALRERTERAVATELQRRARITAEAFYRQGQGHLVAGRPEEAAQSFDLALIWDPDYAEASHSLAEAKSAAEEASISRLLASGLAHYQGGRYIDAIADLGRILELRPEHPSARQWLDKASEALSPKPSRELSDSLAKMVEGYHRSATALLASGRYPQAMGEWRKALELDPKNTLAISSMDRARQLQQQEVSLALAKAEASVKQDNWAAALVQVNRALAIDPDNQDAKDKKTEIEGILRQLSETHSRQGTEYFQRGQYSQAEAELRLALSYNRDNRAASELLNRIGSRRASATAQEISELYLKGINAYTQGDFAQATVYWQQVIDLDPTHANARRNLERAREKLRIIGRPQ